MSHAFSVRGVFHHVSISKSVSPLEDFCNDEVLTVVEVGMRKRAFWASVFYFGLPMLVTFAATWMLF